MSHAAAKRGGNEAVSIAGHIGMGRLELPHSSVQERESKPEVANVENLVPKKKVGARQSSGLDRFSYSV